MTADEVTAAAERTAWERGYTAGKSIMARRMSDEPKAPDYPNPFGADETTGYTFNLRLEKALRERDEALAAIERVKALHTPKHSMCRDCDWHWPCPTLAALKRPDE